jgi:hypothetical protein
MRREGEKLLISAARRNAAGNLRESKKVNTQRERRWPKALSPAELLLGAEAAIPRDGHTAGELLDTFRHLILIRRVLRRFPANLGCLLLRGQRVKAMILSAAFVVPALLLWEIDTGRLQSL